MKLETFFEKFDQFADAPDAVAKMRELVLQLAVQGKLTSRSKFNTATQHRRTRSATEIRMLRITDIQNNRVDWPSVPGCQIEQARLRSIC